MAPLTRSNSTSPVKKAAQKPSQPQVKQQREPLKHFILPKELSSNARFLLLKHPRSSAPQRFLFCPEKGLFEFTKVNAPADDPRSLLFSKSESYASAEVNDNAEGCKEGGTISNGYISKRPDFFIATTFDVAFLLLALILPKTFKSSKALFQPIDDILEDYIHEDKHLRYLFNHGRRFLEQAMLRFCDSIEAGDEHLYRPSEEKTLRMVMQKVNAAICAGLPASLDERFVKRKLELPVLSVRRENSSISTSLVVSFQDNCDTPPENLDSQSSATSSAPSVVFSELSAGSSMTSVAPDNIPGKMQDLQQQNIVLEYILVSYVPPVVAERLQARVAAENSPVNFTPLREHLKTIAKMKADANASRSIGDFSRKRGLEEEEATDLREEKKRKQDEEDRKRKAGESRGVRDLKKVNVTGMKKMSDFFAKKPATKVKS
ncbi:uncharacterized protein A1O9_11512 [Exophiala aquamarina CBS 119918]|uniref:Ribonuclease H2 subunit B n=1 Tax=Exophiala aquamarina CBS 119918 TaxID=1182545 RepID=A0A072NY08_9EURO|nr:uncharacterized protein A1O9_11512 [Exophiala aquamarina CBS 119918]KEF52272.1 hypothetical protein A1O9_11512 [Exophiala aquamarina CBS 119918]